MVNVFDVAIAPAESRWGRRPPGVATRLFAVQL